MRPVATTELIATLTAALEPFGGRAEDRDTAVLWLLAAELTGLSRFGIPMLRKELGRLRAAGVAPAAPSVTTHGAVSSIDAVGTPGPLALAAAARLAAQGVQESGAAVVGIRNVGATGVLGFAARQIAAHGATALVLAESGPVVAPWGGAAPAIGTNPLALAAPRQGLAPFVVDYSTAPLTLAAVREHEDRGQPLPAGVALDAAGAPTTVPGAMAALLPDSKIASLTGLMVQMLAGAATGSGGGATADRYGLRGVTLIAFRAPNADAAADSSSLLERWQAAGGHVPSRFDGVPTALAELPPELTLQAEALGALEGLGASSR